MRSSAPVVLLLVLALTACRTTDGDQSDASDAGEAGPDAPSSDAGADALPTDLPNGEPCAMSSQCRGACCELHRGNTTVCAQIAPFDTTQNCACTDDAECAAIKLCGNPGFCQVTDDPKAQRFCSRVCN